MNLLKTPARPRRRFQRIRHAARKPFASCPGDHGGIVAAKLQRRRHKPRAVGLRKAVEPCADGMVGRDPAGNDQHRRTACFILKATQSSLDPPGKTVDDLRLEGRPPVGHLRIRPRCAPLCFEPHRRLHAGK